jgi:hypothetical protein
MRNTSPTLLQLSDMVEQGSLISPRSASSPRNTVARYNTRIDSLKSFQETINITEKPKKRRSKPENEPLIRKQVCCPLNDVCSDMCDKLSDHLLLGHFDRKIRAEPTQKIEKPAPLSNDDKKEIVLSDPKFGLFSLFLWHATRKKKSNRFYCSDAFSLSLALPLLLFATQWILYIALVSHEVKVFDGDFCPNKGTFENKMMFLGIGLIYFIRSFFIWDSLSVQSTIQKMNRMDNLTAILDTFQEFLFNLLVYAANLWLVFAEDDIQNMIMNSLAMEFLMQADNQFEEMYFANLPEAAVEIYDTMYVSRKENRRLVSKKRDSSYFYNSASCIIVLLYKLLVCVIFLFPLFCLLATIGGTICK